jgi:hypothetical protein
MFFHEDGWTDAGLPITTGRYAETAAINVFGGNFVSNITHAITDSGHSYDSTQITFFGSYTPQGAETTFGPYSPRPDGYTDIRVSGREVRAKIESTKDQEWSIGQVRLDIKPGGKR